MITASLNITTAGTLTQNYCLALFNGTPQVGVTKCANLVGGGAALVATFNQPKGSYTIKAYNTTKTNSYAFSLHVTHY